MATPAAASILSHQWRSTTHTHTYWPSHFRPGATTPHHTLRVIDTIINGAGVAATSLPVTTRAAMEIFVVMFYNVRNTPPQPPYAIHSNIRHTRDAIARRAVRYGHIEATSLEYATILATATQKATLASWRHIVTTAAVLPHANTITHTVVVTTLKCFTATYNITHNIPALPRHATQHATTPRYVITIPREGENVRRAVCACAVV